MVANETGKHDKTPFRPERSTHLEGDAQIAHSMLTTEDFKEIQTLLVERLPPEALD